MKTIYVNGTVGDTIYSFLKDFPNLEIAKGEIRYIQINQNKIKYFVKRTSPAFNDLDARAELWSSDTREIFDDLSKAEEARFKERLHQSEKAKENKKQTDKSIWQRVGDYMEAHPDLFFTELLTCPLESVKFMRAEKLKQTLERSMNTERLKAMEASFKEKDAAQTNKENDFSRCLRNAEMDKKSHFVPKESINAEAFVLKEPSIKKPTFSELQKSKQPEPQKSEPESNDPLLALLLLRQIAKNFKEMDK